MHSSNPIIHIDLRSLDNTPEHQKLLGQFLNQTRAVGKLGKKYSKEGSKIIHQINGQKFTLSHSIMVMPTENGGFIYGMLSSHKEGEETDKRKVLGKGGFGSALKTRRIIVEEMNGEVIAKVAHGQKRVIKKIKVKTQEELDEARREFVVIQNISALEATSKLEVLEKKTPAIYLEMKKARGITLTQVLKKDLSTLERFEISMGVLKSLKKLHDEDTIHRDIKPDNIIVDLETFEVTIIDFGFAEKNGEVKLAPAGTRSYMPFEAVIADVDDPHKLAPATDVYAMHCVLAEIWQGRDDAPSAWENPMKFYLFLQQDLNRFYFNDAIALKDFTEDHRIFLQNVISQGTKRNLNERIELTESLRAHEELYTRFLEIHGNKLLAKAIENNNHRDVNILQERGIKVEAIVKVAPSDKEQSLENNSLYPCGIESRTTILKQKLLLIAEIKERQEANTEIHNKISILKNDLSNYIRRLIEIDRSKDTNNSAIANLQQKAAMHLALIDCQEKALSKNTETIDKNIIKLSGLEVKKQSIPEEKVLPEAKKGLTTLLIKFSNSFEPLAKLFSK